MKPRIQSLPAIIAFVAILGLHGFAGFLCFASPPQPSIIYGNANSYAGNYAKGYAEAKAELPIIEKKKRYGYKQSDAYATAYADVRTAGESVEFAKDYALAYADGIETGKAGDLNPKPEKHFENIIVKLWKNQGLRVWQSKRLPNGTTCDIVTVTHAVEVASPSVSNHYSDIGQAIHYARLLNKRPAAVFITGKNLSREKAIRGLQDLKHAYPESRNGKAARLYGVAWCG